MKKHPPTCTGVWYSKTGNIDGRVVLMFVCQRRGRHVDRDVSRRLRRNDMSLVTFDVKTTSQDTLRTGQLSDGLHGSSQYVERFLPLGGEGAEASRVSELQDHYGLSGRGRSRESLYIRLARSSLQDTTSFGCVNLYCPRALLREGVASISTGTNDSI